MMTLTSSQRKYLRGLAHGLDPLVHIGKAGLAEGVLRNLRDALARHELVKVKFLEHRDQKAALCAQIAQELDCEMAGRIGHTATFYRPADEPADRQIRLPR